MKPILLLSTVLSLVAPAFAADSAPAKPADAYPLATCVVSGEALDSMDGPYIHVHKEAGKPDREIRLCCKGCLKKFSKDPAKYVAKLDAAKTETGKADKPAAPAADAHAGHNH